MEQYAAVIQGYTALGIGIIIGLASRAPLTLFDARCTVQEKSRISARGNT